MTKFTLEKILEDPQSVGVPNEHVQASGINYFLNVGSDRRIKSDVYLKTDKYDFFVFVAPIEHPVVGYARAENFSKYVAKHNLCQNPMYVIALKDPQDFGIMASEWTTSPKAGMLK